MGYDMTGFVETNLTNRRKRIAALGDIYVTSLSELPTPSGGKHIFENGKHYRQLVPISTSDVFDFPADYSGSYTVENKGTNTTTYTGSGTFISSASPIVSLELINLNVIATNSAANIFGMIGGSGAQSTFRALECFFTGFGDIGTIDDFFFGGFDATLISGFTEGLVATDNIQFTMNNVVIFSTGSATTPHIQLLGNKLARSQFLGHQPGHCDDVPC